MSKYFSTETSWSCSQIYIIKILNLFTPQSHLLYTISLWDTLYIFCPLFGLLCTACFTLLHESIFERLQLHFWTWNLCKFIDRIFCSLGNNWVFSVIEFWFKVTFKKRNCTEDHRVYMKILENGELEGIHLCKRSSRISMFSDKRLRLSTVRAPL